MNGYRWFPSRLAGCIFLQCIVFIIAGAASVYPALTEDRPDCDFGAGPCFREVKRLGIAFDIQPKPVKAMETLTFVVKVTGGKVRGGITIDLDMPGMFMGKNRVVLKEVAEGTFRGTGVIPRCPSGKRLWRASVRVHDTGTARFLFDVDY